MSVNLLLVGNQTESKNMWAVGGLQQTVWTFQPSLKWLKRVNFFIISSNTAITLPFACDCFRSLFLMRQGR